MQPGIQVIEDRSGMGLPEAYPLVGWLTAGLLFDGINPGDALDRFLGNDRALGMKDIDELAPDMCQARHLKNAAGMIEVVEAAVAVGVHPARVAGQMPSGM